ncbi:DUF427-domain-containing protein [Pyrenochaeta sp. DS3sAY3a]|nr:DUF427-domain-containing protein [Pyrenochaeta sp. DS3sAY3a]
MANTGDLEKLAQKLVSEGPHKVEQTPRRVRGLFNGKFAFDTTSAYFVWEHPYYPQFYIPASSITPAAKLDKLDPVPNTHSSAHFARLTVDSEQTTRVIIFNTPALPNLVKVDFPAISQWFEEDTRIYGHPKDPYKRIVILPSSRHIKISFQGVTLAETTNALILLETTLRPRYYIPPTHVNWEVLSESQTRSICPYKGEAEYYSVGVGGKEYGDLVWYYRYPTAESAEIAGRLSFYNEKVEVWVDGVKEES